MTAPTIASVPALDPVEQLADLRMDADLSAAQIGRLLGVTPRTVHGWLDGVPVPESRAELLDRLTAMVDALPGGNPAARRAALLDSSAGPSPFHAWLAALPQPAVLQAVAVPVAGRIALPEDRRPRHAVRRMVAADVPAVVALFDVALGAGYVDADELRGYATPPGKTAFVAEDPAGHVVAAATGLTASGHAVLGTMPDDQRRAVLGLVPGFLDGQDAVGLLKSVAVDPGARRLGLGRAVSGAVVDELTAAGASTVVSLGWTDWDGCHIEGTLCALGFEARGDLRDFWWADSVLHGYACPSCGHPCRCTARIFSR